MRILGYADDEVDEAVIKVIKDGVSTSLNCKEEVELAEKPIIIPGLEQDIQEVEAKMVSIAIKSHAHIQIGRLCYLVATMVGMTGT